MEEDIKDLDQFKAQFLSLKQKHLSSNGLTEKQFNKIVSSAYSKYKYKKSHPCVYWFWKVCRLLFLTVVLLYVISFAGSVWIEKSKTANKVALSLIHDHEILYHMNRITRLAALPLHSLFDIGKVYRWECLVDNPFSTGPTPMCHMCEGLEGVEVLSSTQAEAIKERSETSPAPFVVFDDSYYSKRVFTYEELRSLIIKHKSVMDGGNCEERFFSNPLKDNILNTIVRNNYSEIVALNFSGYWSTCEAHATRTLRSLYPRPGFLPKGKEVTIEKHTLIMAPYTSMKVPRSRFRGQFLVQLLGRSRINLLPDPTCPDTCDEPLEIYLNAGEILVFGEGFPWVIEAEAASDQLSLIHILQSD